MRVASLNDIRWVTGFGVGWLLPVGRARERNMLSEVGLVTGVTRTGGGVFRGVARRD